MDFNMLRMIKNQFEKYSYKHSDSCTFSLMEKSGLLILNTFAITSKVPVHYQTSLFIYKLNAKQFI